MLNETLEKLKVKPEPKKFDQVNIFIQTPGIGKMPNLIDKTKDTKFDREDFFNQIAEKLDIKNMDQQFKSKKSDKTLKEDIKIDLDKDIKTKIDKEVEKTKSSEKSENILKNIIKTDKKIVISLPDDATSKKSKMPPQDRMTPKPEKTKKEKTHTIDETIILPKDLRFGRTLYVNRIPKPKPNILIKASEYYLYNREIFINFINSLFSSYKEELIKQERDIEEGKISIDCNDTNKNDFSLLIHQKIVRDYINVYTPYRGLLLYHGLGSGKTCSSIAIAEGMKNDKQIMVMTPASLRDNYIEELKKCGDYLYKKNQFWEFLSIKTNPSYVEYLSTILKISQEDIKKNGGAWFINVKKEPNYESLSFEDQKSVNEQIDKMISYKYQFVNYNGLRSSHLKSLSQDGKINPFDNKVVIIDEAHNFISRIVNKLKRKSSLSMSLYNLLLEAENCKIILLTGTPIINYPNEIAILFNILRGSIKSLSCKLQIEKKITETTIDSILTKSDVKKYIEDFKYNSMNYELTFTLNPFGYVTKTKNKLIYESDTVSTKEIMKKIKDALEKNNIKLMSKDINVTHFKALPDDFETFKNYFINANNTAKNSDLFKMRIVGLTSYFRSAQEQLMPTFDKENPDYFTIVKIPMSDFQFGVYEEARVQERKLEDTNKKKKAKKKTGAEGDEVYGDSVSTYRIFSRAFCNFVFPKPDIKRPMPTNNDSIETVIDNIEYNAEVSEDVVDDVKIKDKLEDMDGNYEADDIKEITSQSKDASYGKRIEEALKLLEDNSSKYLTREGLKTYSPKFLYLLENIIDADYKGIHLLYSQFKTLEGIGIFKLVLKENNFCEFKIKKNSKGEYILNVDEEDIGKPMFASYTGSETQEEREIIKNVLNSNWKMVPSTIVEQIKQRSPNNYLGEIIKVLMITSSGAEGISLKNVRYVHILEPYWHPVRINQVIGRARRICSHSDLPKELQNVRVFLYLMMFSKEQLESESSIELRLKDKSKRDKEKIITSDEFLYEISEIKEEINREILNNVKESSIDCSIHSRSKSDKEKLKCFIIGNASESKYIYTPNIKEQEDDTMMQINKKKQIAKLKELEINKQKYAYNEESGDIYDFDSYEKGEILLVGKIEKLEDGKFKFKKIT